jgi:hypothetical protein
MKTCVIKQPVGIGDVLFCQKIGQFFARQGYQVKWPVRDDFLWYNDYLISPGIQFTPLSKPIKSDLFIDLQNADRKISGPIMQAKYKLVHLDYRDWADYLNFNRDPEKENDLYYNVLGLEDDTKYIFRNIHFGTPPINRVLNIPINTSLKIIDNTIYKGFNVIDWSKVIENAEEIHIVDTVYNYIMEKLIMKAKVIYLFSRHIPSNFYHIQNLFKVKYSYR